MRKAKENFVCIQNEFFQAFRVYNTEVSVNQIINQSNLTAKKYLANNFFFKLCFELKKKIFSNANLNPNLINKVNIIFILFLIFVIFFTN